MKLLIPLATIAVSATLGSAIAVAVVKETDGSAAPATTVVREASGSPAAATSGSQSIGDIYRSNVTGVVEIKVQTTTTADGAFGPQQQAAEAQGTGFEVDRKGDIVTNAHVVAGARAINVTTDDGHSYTATLVGSDPSTDVAVIHINASASALHPLTFADSSTVQVGDEVVAIGDPFGLTDSATAGIVSALNRTITSPNNSPITNAIQTDAAINHGNSGGPLLNADGKVVGMNTLGDPDTQNQNFAIASDHINSLLGDIERGVNHAWLGWYLEYLADDPSQPLVKDDAGNAYYGPAVVGPTAGHGSEGVLQGMAGGKDQYVYAIDGHKFGAGDDDIPPGTDAMTALCAVAGDKKTGDTVKLGVLTHDGSGWSANDVDVKLK
jgi:S1-C subfamily serine protease